MKKIMILCITLCAFISNHTMFGMLTSKCRSLATKIHSQQLRKQLSDHNYPELVGGNYPQLLRDLQAEKAVVENKIKFVTDIMSEGDKTITFRSEDRVNHNRSK